VGLRPIYVLLGVTVFGGLLGFWGIILGVPLMAIIQMLLKERIARQQAEKTLIHPQRKE
jgi:predicted PurR-regulated permease PerM